MLARFFSKPIVILVLIATCLLPIYILETSLALHTHRPHLKDGRQKKMRYTDDDDVLLLRQVLAENPYAEPKKWIFMLELLKAETGHKPLSVKNMRERINLLLEQFEKKDTVEIVTSGIEPPPQIEKDLLLEQVRDLKRSFRNVAKKGGRTATSIELGRLERDIAAKEHWESAHEIIERTKEEYNVSHYYTGFKEGMAARMLQRKKKVREACERYGLNKPGNDTLHRPNPWEFLINRKHHLVWCNIFKAASTSWMYNFNILAGYKKNFLRRTNIVPLQLARRRYPRPSLSELKTALNNSYSFIIVRHPLERLLSAYRDKIQYALPNTPHQKLGHEIIAKYRKQYKKGDKKSSFPRWPTISEFVNYLMDSRKKGEALDMHWATMTEFCTPCQINFDIIIKFETLEEDQMYLIELVGVEDKIKPEWKNPSKGRVTQEVLQSYYSQLTVDQVLALYSIYKYDFDLFGYSIKKYLEMAKKPPSPLKP